MIHLPDSENDPAICSATLELGEIHWHLIRAVTVMFAKTYLMKTVVKEREYRFEITEFGKEVGGDEIKWWISKKETNIEQLRQRSQRALEAAQSLKQAADTLRGNRFEYHREVVESLREYAEDHTQEIDVIHDYVRWLSERDIMAPHILFTKRVWGSTWSIFCPRMDDDQRYMFCPRIDVDAKEREEERRDTIHQFAEMVVGLRASYELDFSRPSVVSKSSAEIFKGCSTYFTELTDSLRNILLDIDNIY